MYKFLLPVVLVALALTSCGGSNSKNSKYPKNFNSIGDESRVEYIINHASPDSVARFIVYGALGRDKDARIDTLAIATNHAYEKLTGKDLDEFSVSYDAIVGSLPLADKMKMYQLDGGEEALSIGYKLGLEYVTSIREGNKKSADIEKELAEFKKACGNDTAMQRRFMIGFKTVLELDSGKDVPKDIYMKYTK